MATLNQRETTALHNAQVALEMVLRDGYDPSKEDDLQTINKRRQLEAAKDGVRTVVIIKGHYPKG